MRLTSKDLLELEKEKLPLVESCLHVCKDPLSSKKNEHFNKNVDSKLSITTVPTSQVLGRIKDFLGVMAEDNKRLELDAQGKSDEHYNIEVLTGNEKEYIEMDLLLGVTDLHTPEAVAAAESALAGSHPSFPLSASSESDSEDNEDESDDEDDNCSPNLDKKPNLGGQHSLSNDKSKKRRKITELP